ncbi:GNAT family N-acetyltransferase [Paraglaciecola aquimarina]|uniref:GNAT family N-acetyltransferase n=1 Tax=Paraglaciecola algarum TaxID=3050085 RepID=A0ABS9D5V8_9ALTE|nr:GNAT family N-acetyltransferase [Paraglaciecola sp. G1-23]MCF2948299.1 GNAT family N-acetyltransferase [Paraglaciecola sp. G1-23]
MQIREAHESDFEGIWCIFQGVAAAGETYAYDRSTNRSQAIKLWCEAPRKTYVAVQDNQVLATYYLKNNQAGPGNHVCNCGYMVAPEARGKGLATLLCEHSEKIAVELGYSAMQFNFVAASNVGAIRLWHKSGFETVGRLPKAFNHPKLGLVDALVMYKWFAEEN